MGRPRLVLARLANHRSTNTHPGSERLASYTVARTLRGNKTDGLGLVDLEAHASFVLLYAANLLFSTPLRSFVQEQPAIYSLVMTTVPIRVYL